MEDRIDILVTVDEHYLSPLEVMLTSLHLNNPHRRFRIWLLHENISSNELNVLRNFITSLGSELEVKQVEGTLLKDSPSIIKYPKEMYFRLLCGELLPESVTKIIYLDPDILVINPIDALWNLDLGDYMMAAAAHTGLMNIAQPFHHIRLKIKHAYFNSGVMLINTQSVRKTINLTEIYQCINDYENVLLLPDQDVLNHLYGSKIVEVPDEIWNFDTKQPLAYFTKSKGIYDTKWMIKNTVILHFCGKPKPWNQKTLDRFSMLYQHYVQITNRIKEKVD